MNELALFAGAGGGILGSVLLGHRIVCAVEIEPYCREVLLRRQEENILPPFPIWDDVRTFNGKQWCGKVDIVSAGFPCQPFSVAGKRKGKDDSRNMWPDTIRIVREVRPEWCLLENVPGLFAHDYIRRIFGDLAESGFDCQWDCISAAAQGAPHIRDRLWIVAHAKCMREPQPQGCQQNKRRWVGDSRKEGAAHVAHTQGEQSGRKVKPEVSANIGADGKGDGSNAIKTGCQNTQGSKEITERNRCGTTCCPSWWDVEPDVGGLLPNGMAIELGENINETLCNMWKKLAEEKVRESVRGSWSFRETEILQPLMYDYWANKRKAIQECNRKKNSTLSEIFMRDMRNIGRSWNTPQGQEPLQQQIGELADALLFVSYILASQTGRFDTKEAETTMQYLRQNIIQAWTLFNPSFTFQEAWQSIDSSWKASFVLGRWVFEPPITRTITGLPFRVDRLKALGNGQVPAVVEKAWKLLNTIDSKENE